jgi:site-specific DNA recombinase
MAVVTGAGPLRVALYVRVSTEEQAREGFSVAAQVAALRAFAASQGWREAGLYADEGFSGKDLRRPRLERLVADARAGRFDAVLVWRLDRLSRRQAHTLRLIEEVLEPAGVGLRSATETFDTTTAAGKAMVGMLAVFAQLERESIVERTRLGLRERARQGKWSGAAPWGYRYAETGQLAPDPVVAPWVRRLFARAAAGEGMAALAAWLAAEGAPAPRAGGRWWPGTVRLILRNRVYVGERRVHAAWVPGGHAALVGPEDFAAAQPRGGGAAPRGGYLLAGLAVCAHCGSPLRGKRQRWPGGRHRRYYICQGRATGRQPGCPFGWQDARRADEAVIAAVGRLPGPVPAPRLQPAAGEAVAACDARMARLLRAVEEGWLEGPEAAARLAALRRQRERLAASQAAPPPGAAELALDFPTLARLAGAAQRRAMLRALVSRVVLARGPRVTALLRTDA